MSVFIDKPIQIVGLSIITSYQTAEKDIGELWGRFFSSSIKETLSEAISSDKIFCVYSDYESDHLGQYRTTIGYAANNIDVPTELSSVIIPAGKYKTYHSKTKEVADLIATWQEIWATDTKFTLPRNYMADFEIHSDTETVIYIGHH